MYSPKKKTPTSIGSNKDAKKRSLDTESDEFSDVISKKEKIKTEKESGNIKSKKTIKEKPGIKNSIESDVPLESLSDESLKESLDEILNLDLDLPDDP